MDLLQEYTEDSSPGSAGAGFGQAAISPEARSSDSLRAVHDLPAEDDQVASTVREALETEGSPNGGGGQPIGTPALDGQDGLLDLPTGLTPPVSDFLADGGRCSSVDPDFELAADARMEAAALSAAAAATAAAAAAASTSGMQADDTGAAPLGLPDTTGASPSPLITPQDIMSPSGSGEQGQAGPGPGPEPVLSDLGSPPGGDNELLLSELQGGSEEELLPLSALDTDNLDTERPPSASPELQLPRQSLSPGPGSPQRWALQQQQQPQEGGSSREQQLQGAADPQGLTPLVDLDMGMDLSGLNGDISMELDADLDLDHGMGGSDLAELPNQALQPPAAGVLEDWQQQRQQEELQDEPPPQQQRGGCGLTPDQDELLLPNSDGGDALEQAQAEEEGRFDAEALSQQQEQQREHHRSRRRLSPPLSDGQSQPQGASPGAVQEDEEQREAAQLAAKEGSAEQRQQELQQQRWASDDGASDERASSGLAPTGVVEEEEQGQRARPLRKRQRPNADQEDLGHGPEPASSGQGEEAARSDDEGARPGRPRGRHHRHHQQQHAPDATAADAPPGAAASSVTASVAPSRAGAEAATARRRLHRQQHAQAPPAAPAAPPAPPPPKLKPTPARGLGWLYVEVVEPDPPLPQEDSQAERARLCAARRYGTVHGLQPPGWAHARTPLGSAVAASCARLDARADAREARLLAWMFGPALAERFVAQ